jgi:N6-L-threonylcarbamoyladenine synthase
MILAIETSCDDTCAAVLDSNGEVLSNIVGSQSIHDLYGGVVPELAARHHLELLNPVIDKALDEAGVSLNDIERIAVTQGPGLVGALLVGLSAAKGLASALDVPLRPVDHLDGHVAATWFADSDLASPFNCLIASGGHTLLVRVGEDPSDREVLGQTLDDAAGEAFDKGARLLGLGYPGGPLIEKLALEGDPEAFDFPTARGVSGLDFSFSGLKTSLLYAVRELGDDGVAERRADLAASYQRAIVAQLADRAARAADMSGDIRLGFGGGVAASSAARRALQDAGLDLTVPEMRFCTDNAAMIGRASLHVKDLTPQEAATLDAYATRPDGNS